MKKEEFLNSFECATCISFEEGKDIIYVHYKHLQILKSIVNSIYSVYDISSIYEKYEDDGFEIMIKGAEYLKKCVKIEYDAFRLFEDDMNLASRYQVIDDKDLYRDFKFYKEIIEVYKQECADLMNEID